MIKFNEVTKTSMIVAVVLYVGTFALGFALGGLWEEAKSDIVQVDQKVYIS